jgi:hypothetical protein
MSMEMHLDLFLIKIPNYNFCRKIILAHSYSIGYGLD